MMDIDDLIYPMLASSFSEYEEGEILDIVEEFKHPRGLDESSEFEQEVWQKYLALKRDFKAGSFALPPASHAAAAAGEAAQV
jgi:hypothetical protein